VLAHFEIDLECAYILKEKEWEFRFVPVASVLVYSLLRFGGCGCDIGRGRSNDSQMQGAFGFECGCMSVIAYDRLYDADLSIGRRHRAKVFHKAFQRVMCVNVCACVSVLGCMVMIDFQNVRPFASINDHRFSKRYFDEKNYIPILFADTMNIYAYNISVHIIIICNKLINGVNIYQLAQKL
jgi:hypothetical protein